MSYTHRYTRCTQPLSRASRRAHDRPPKGGRREAGADRPTRRLWRVRLTREGEQLTTIVAASDCLGAVTRALPRWSSDTGPVLVSAWPTDAETVPGQDSLGAIEWLSHAAFDAGSALECGPSNGGAQIPCPGVLHVTHPEDAMVLATCDVCGSEFGVPRSVVETQRAEPERPERWWDR